MITVPQVVESVSDVLTTALTGGQVYYDDAKFSGAILLGVKLPSRNGWRFGVDGVYEKFTKKVYSDSDDEFLGDTKGTYMSLIPRADYYWLDRKYVRLYSGVGAGASLVNQQFNQNEKQRVLFAFNVVPLGVEAGGLVSVFADVTFGFNGLVNCGLRLRL